MDLSSKVVVITGAAQGLGRIVAQKLDGQGASLALIDIDKERLDNVVAGLNKGKAYECDISKHEEVAACVEKILEDFGHIDILINGAGVWTDDKLEESRPELRRKALEINALGHIQIVEGFLPHFKSSNGGHILEIISTSGVSDIRDGDNSEWKSYGASKWAVRGYINALKKSLGNTAIKVTSFFPGGFESNLYENAQRQDAHDQPWMMKTEDVADVILYCLSCPADVQIDSIVVTKKAAA